MQPKEKQKVWNTSGKFLRGKGFALALLACIAAAAAAGVWAVGAIRDQMARDLGESPSQNITGEETFPGIDQGAGPETEEQLWEQEAASAAQPAADVPESSSSGGPSGAPSGSGSVSRTLRAANRIARCQRVSRLGVYAARLWAGARRLERR